jgi:hypothetical protein
MANLQNPFFGAVFTVVFVMQPALLTNYWVMKMIVLEAASISLNNCLKEMGVNQQRKHAYT